MTRRPHRFSQCAKLLRILEDGEWHTTADLLREVPCVVHSRVAELRKSYGCHIEHETTGPGARGSRYRLLTSDAAMVPGEIPGQPVLLSGPDETAASDLVLPRPAEVLSSSPRRAAPSEQLALVAAPEWWMDNVAWSVRA